jgi:hypothetical protein
MGSEEFFARFEALLPAVRPSYAALPGWTYNDKTGDIKADQTAAELFLARLLSAIELCEANGIIPIIFTPFPRDAKSMTEVQVKPWRWLRDAALALRSSTVIVIDASAILGQQEQSQFTGTYKPGASDEEVHPNDAGHNALAQALANTIVQCL